MKETTVSNTTTFLNSIRLHKSIKSAAQLAIEIKGLVVWNRDFQAVFAKRAKDADDITLFDFSEDTDTDNPFADDIVVFDDADTYMAVGAIDRCDHDGLNAFLSRDYD